MEPGHLQHFQVGDTHHHQGEQKGERLQRHGEHDELRLGAVARSAAAARQRARRVKLMVAEPGQAGGHRGEAERMDPGVPQGDHRVPVADPRVVAERKHHRHPPVDAQRGHGEHRVSDEKKVEETDHLTKDGPPGVPLAEEPRHGQRHVGHAQQQVAQSQVEGEQRGHLFADLRVVQKADQHHNVRQQRHHNDPQNNHGGG